MIGEKGTYRNSGDGDARIREVVEATTDGGEGVETRARIGAFNIRPGGGDDAATGCHLFR